jgi:RNA polymerase II elongation factor ELL
MNSLKVPEQGLRLESSPNGDTPLPTQAFAITLNDKIIEDMIRCVRGGEEIQLSLGAAPTLLYGSQSHKIAPPADSHPYDLYLTKPFESTRRADRVPHAGSLFKKPKKSFAPAEPRETKADTQASKSSMSSKSSASSGLDSDLEALQNGLAKHDASQKRARISENVLAGSRPGAKPRGKLLPGSGIRSSTTSPALIPVRSPPDTTPISATQQAMERKKELRTPLVHELAVKDRTLEYLRQKWEWKESELQPTLEKVADYMSETKKWAMKKLYWKELDVWNYDYDTQEDRQTAIDNAVRRYDNLRVSSSDPEWERLLPKSERGKGRCLSRLQANIAKGPPQPPPKIKVQKADDHSGSKDDGDVLRVEKLKEGGESMLRSSSNPLPKAAKKANAPEPVAKKWMSAKTKNAPTPKAATPSLQKTSPAKPKAAPPKTNGVRVLSQAIITNSDSSEDEDSGPPPKPAPAAKPISKPSPRPKDTVVVKPKPVVREPIRQQPVKRSREDDDSSSSSGTPLAKRKQPALPTAPKQRVTESKPIHRPIPAPRAKVTSPTKSSPLASSPPTNASDIDAPPPIVKKRKAEMDGKLMSAKRVASAARVSVSSEVLTLSYKFKSIYAQYEAMHYEISALENPPSDKVSQLVGLRSRLKDMKSEIYQKQSASDRE